MTDNGGATGSDEVIITVTPNQVPVADAGPDQTLGDSDGNGQEAVTLDGSGSYDLDGNVDTYVWKEGTTTIGTGVNPVHNFDVGTHTVTLTVTDNGGATDSAEVVITVIEGSPTPTTMHISDIAMSKRIIGINTIAIATVTISDDFGNPLEGAIVSGHWTGQTDDSDSGITDANGIITFNSDRVKRASGTFTFTVTNVIYDGLTWDGVPKSGTTTA